MNKVLILAALLAGSLGWASSAKAASPPCVVPGPFSMDTMYNVARNCRQGSTLLISTQGIGGMVEGLIATNCDRRLLVQIESTHIACTFVGWRQVQANIRP